MNAFKYSIALAAILASSAAFADDLTLRDLSVEQAPVAAIVAPHPGQLATAIVADRPDATYAIGETVRLTLTANQDSYVTVLDVGPTGAATELFPNKFQPDNHVRAGAPVEIAGPTTGAHITVGQPTGTELIKVITSNKPIAVVQEGQLSGAGPFRTVEGGVRAVTRDLSVVADQPPSTDTFIAFANYALYTIPSRAPAAVTVVIPSQQAPVAPPASFVNVPAEQPFPLLIATDKVKYRIGEKATVAVTTTQACNLTVLEFSGSGVARTLYPAAGAPSATLAANQTAFIGGGAGPDLVLAGPVGFEQLLAVCTTADAAAGAALPPAAPNAATDTVVVAKNLSVVANKPGSAMASVILTVTP
jgi:hypothetical protein